MFGFLKGRLILVRIIMIAATMALIAIGIATIYAVGHPAEAEKAASPELANYWKKQLVFAILSFVAFIAVNFVNYRKLGEISYWLYAGIILMLTILLFSRYVIELPFAPEIKNTHRWINISFGSLQLPSLQPSEFCKIIYILALAWYLRYRSNYRRFKALIGPFALTLLPMVLILLEPDLGTVMLMMPILFTMLFIAGAKVKHLLLIIMMAAMVSPLLWSKMKPYQRIRISCVLLQNHKIQELVLKNDKLGNILVGEKFTKRKWESEWGHQLLRSKYAIASGGENVGTGYGFRRGTFLKYNFLWARHNDFIFAIIAHQWGLWGALVLFGLYAVIIACAMEIAQNNTDPFARLLAVGIAAMFAVEVIVNVGMTIGLMPITGLTLPLVSYGGSSLLVSMMAIGLLNNIGRCMPFGMRRKTPKYSASPIRQDTPQIGNAGKRT